MSHHTQDPSDTPITEVVVLRNGVEVHRHPCESEQEAADIIAHWEELPGVECTVVDLTTGRDQGATDIAWLDSGTDYPPVESDPSSRPETVEGPGFEWTLDSAGVNRDTRDFAS